MVISPPTNGVIMVILGETDKFIPENLNSEKVVIFRRDKSTNNELKMIKELGRLADPELLKKPESKVCTYTDNIIDGNPLHEHADGTWWFYEETWAFENGPFESWEDGDNALEAYCRTVLALKENLEEEKDGDENKD